MGNTIDTQSAGYPNDGGGAVEAFLVAELTEERQRRVRIDARGSALITGSTALSALAFAAVTIVTEQKSFVLPRISLWALSLTFLAFMFAAFCGLRASARYHRNQVVPIAVIESWRRNDDLWRSGRSEAMRDLLKPVILYLGDIRRFNRNRAKWIILGAGSQIAALFGLSVAIGCILAAAIAPDATGWFHILEPP